MVYETVTRTYGLKNGRGVAMIDDGDAIIEAGDFVHEGVANPGASATTARNIRPGWRRSSASGSSTPPDPHAIESVQALIVLSGDGDTGRMEIRRSG